MIATFFENVEGLLSGLLKQVLISTFIFPGQKNIILSIDAAIIFHWCLLHLSDCKVIYWSFFSLYIFKRAHFKKDKYKHDGKRGSIKRIYFPCFRDYWLGNLFFVGHLAAVEMGYWKNSDRPFASPLARTLGIDRVRLTVVLFAWMKAICQHWRFRLKAICSRIGTGILIVCNYFFYRSETFLFWSTRVSGLSSKVAQKRASKARSH